MGSTVSDPEVVLVNSNLWKPALAPLALDYLGAALMANDIEYDVLDPGVSDDSEEAIRDYFKDRKPRLVGITFRNLDDILYGISFLGDLRRVVNAVRDAVPSAEIILGGSGFSIAPEAILDYCGVDLGVWGEGEEALPLLCKHLGDTSTYPSIPGLVYRTNQGIMRNPQGCMSMENFIVKGACRKTFPSYCREGRMVSNIGVQTKRGCANCCSYCAVPNIEGLNRRLRPPELVVDEMEDAVEQGARTFFVADSEFNDPHDHAVAICEEILRRGLERRMTWSAYVACNDFSEELAGIMKRSGCELAICDFDSASDVVLEKNNKRHRTEHIVATVEAARKTELNMTYSLLIGGLGETLETLQETTDFLRKTGVKRVTVTEPAGIRLYPGTPAANAVFEQGFNSRNPNLWGPVEGNENLLKPVFYISSELGVLRSINSAWRTLSKAYYKMFPITKAKKKP